MANYRVFLSYSRRDGKYVECLAEIFARAGVQPMWDRSIAAGRSFSEQIKSYIEHAHVFAPVLAPSSQDSVWMHAEIGYTMALHIPILPICIGKVPAGMIQSVQAVTLPPKPAASKAFVVKAREELSFALVQSLVHSSERGPEIMQCARDNVHRAQLLADYARRVMEIGHSGLVRQKASLTSFHLPSRPPPDLNWELYFGKPVRENLSLYEALSDERRSLLKHARAQGCRLIIDPAEMYVDVYKRCGPRSAPARVQGLIEFLEQAGADGTRVEVAVNRDPKREESMTIVGDWFSSEAVSSKVTANLREAIFTRSASVVTRQIELFDAEFDRLLKTMGWSRTGSAGQAIGYLRKALGKPQTVKRRRG